MKGTDSQCIRPAFLVFSCWLDVTLCPSLSVYSCLGPAHNQGGVTVGKRNSLKKGPQNGSMLPPREIKAASR